MMNTFHAVVTAEITSIVAILKRSYLEHEARTLLRISGRSEYDSILIPCIFVYDSVRHNGNWYLVRNIDN